MRSKAIREVAVSQKVQDLLRMIYRRGPIPFQTLNFHRGTEQDSHSDTIHFQSYPCELHVWGMDRPRGHRGRTTGRSITTPGAYKLPLYDLFDISTEVDKGDYGNYRVYVEFVRELMETVGLERKELELAKGRYPLGGEPLPWQPDPGPQ